MLEENISLPQECRVNGQNTTLMKIKSDNNTVYASVEFDKLGKRIRVPIDDIKSGKGSQNI